MSLLKEVLPQGDYCEIYICWLDEECESELIINLNPQIEAIDFL